MGAIGVLLLGTGVTAFGIAPLAPDAAKLPVSQVIESLALEPLVVDTLAAAVPLTLFRSDTIRRDDTAQSLLQRLGVSDTAAQNFLRADPTARQLFSGRSSKMVSVETSDSGELLRLTARWLPDDGRLFNRLVIEKQTSGLSARIETGELTASAQLASGTIHSSLFAATDAANLPDSVAVQLAEIFASEIDFRRDLRQGDRFSVVYETLEADGEAMRAGRVLSAEFINNGREHEAVWFDGEGKKGAYYGFDGQSSRKSYLTSPLEFSRVSSGYGMRFHPISGQRKAHLGVDYAAPTGTPVRTIGDGVVTFAGWQRGYGNVIQIQHKDRQSTLYAHLSRIDVSRGQRVNQGDRVGAVGSTGASTGPHLHFEFRTNDVPQDPLEIARQSETIPVSPALRARFDAVAQLQRLQLDAAATLQQASAQ
ncbi:MAG: peptidoglycan DD-metalloendopeptidase family protein [Hydrogenophaga sp.]|nr:M23 family metallopeptidase [Hydrogenophaga sp.]MDO9483015.1 peptidoglycan DD-metalloendopeptidase family protein [Hydrogenophaga sp.]MDO9572246.1 peptidoglycan DD-metalloendopeptidase family protein [Hydrogenophaga sp.]MDP2093119.1 peptidoglycan DD-metalloendopeptidase family protein [Hydrogenophaga sp.]MDP2222390.1 peptidoglycan DD-metalloendopeptidase family protein [Hydrogenophaga sp.]MDP3342963.1 peptidoglycan DD-metalloendopeptidase family protein [Hydrogenophaga sp.]